MGVRTGVTTVVLVTLRLAALRVQSRVGVLILSTSSLAIAITAVVGDEESSGEEVEMGMAYILEKSPLAMDGVLWILPYTTKREKANSLFNNIRPTN